LGKTFYTGMLKMLYGETCLPWIYSYSRAAKPVYITYVHVRTGGGCMVVLAE